jgi:hypothetical protein
MQTITKVNSNMWRRAQGKRFPVNGLVFYAPLWHPELNTSPFISKDLNAHSCTVTGATWGITGRTFDGTDDIINCGSDAVLDGLTSSLTICSWVYANSSGEGGFGRIIEKSGNLDSFMGGVGAESIYFNIIIGTVPKTPSANLSYGAWHCVIFEYDHANSEVFVEVDGVKGTPVAATGNIDSHAASDFIIGNDSGTARTWDGVIGEVLSYNRALTPAERLNYYQSTKWRY